MSRTSAGARVWTLVLAGCAGGGAAGSSVQAPVTSASVPHERPADVSPASLLARSPEDAEVLLRLTVARSHPLGPRLEPFVLAWPGWGATLRRISEHPVTELDWIDIVGPRDAAKERMATRTATDDAAMDARLGSNGDGTLRVITRGQPHLVAASPPDGAAALTAALGATHVVDPPASSDLGLSAELPHPHLFFAQIPDEVRRATLQVYGRPLGAAEARLDLVCDDGTSAARVAGELRDEAEGANGMVVKMLTHDLLGGLTVEVEASTARLRLPASREQLEALATLAAAMLTPESPR